MLGLNTVTIGNNLWNVRTRATLYAATLWGHKKYICHRTTFYSIFNMSSCRKPKIQKDLPKITKIK